jgi:hypothetical protein
MMEQQLMQRPGEAEHVAGRHQLPGQAMVQHLRCAADIAGDDREAHPSGFRQREKRGAAPRRLDEDVGTG